MKGRKPDECVNYKNNEHLDTALKDLKKRVIKMERKQQEELKMMKLKTEMEFKDTKEQLKNYSADISFLKKMIQELGEHRDTVGGNITVIEERLHITERQLREKKVKLEHLEKQTNDALTKTQKLLDQYENGLSHLNSTTQVLEDKVEVRLHATKTDLEAQLQKVQKNSAKLTKHKAEVDEFMKETGSKFSRVDEQMRIQKTTVEQQNSDINALKSKTTGRCKTPLIPPF